MSKEAKLVYLVEYKNHDDRVETRWLFSTNKKAIHCIKKELCLEYNKRTRHWEHKDDHMYAELTTLILD